MTPEEAALREKREAPKPNPFLEHYLLVHLNDKRRALLGLLVCADTHGNIILQETTEYLVEPTGQLIASRFVPLLMVPGKYIDRVAKSSGNEATLPSTWDPYM